MSSSQFSRWVAVLLLVGCDAKLQVDPAASGGDGGVSGRSVTGAAGTTIAGNGPIDEQAGESAGGDGNNGGADNGGGGYAGGLCYPVACAAGTGGLGAGGALPGPGDRGQACVPGGSPTEADGSPAKTTITTLDRCQNGLACDSTKHCAGIPACPQATGPCLVHGVPLEDPIGANASGGMGGYQGFGGAAPVAGAGGVFQAPIVQDESGVTAMATDDTHLYWLDYGTRDGLGNYQQDGTLFSYGFADSKTSTVVANLPGPNALGITSGHAYVAVDGGPLVGSPAQAQVLRLPLTGGASEIVQDNVSAMSFGSFSDQAFWGTTTGLYTVLPTAGATASTLLTQYAAEIAVDATSVYATNDTFIFSVPTTGTTSTPLVGPGYTFALGGDSLYGIEPLNDSFGLILDFVAKTGGTWARTRALGSGGNSDRLQIIGDRFFFSANPINPDPDSTKAYIETGLISSPTTTLRLVEKSALQPTQRLLWTATATAVFWSDRSAIFTRSVTGK